MKNSFLRNVLAELECLLGAFSWRREWAVDSVEVESEQSAREYELFFWRAIAGVWY